MPEQRQPGFALRGWRGEYRSCLPPSAKTFHWLAELLPDLPAFVVPIAGYYPNIPAVDHNIHTKAKRIKDVPIRPMHFKKDLICSYECVSNM